MRSSLNRQPDTLLKNLLHRLHDAVISRDIGVDPLVLLNPPPTDFKSGIHDQVFKQDALRTTVAFAEGVYDVDVGIGLCHSDYQLSPFHALEPVCRGHLGDDLIGFLLHVLRLAKAGGLFGHANGAQLSGPFEQV